MESVVLVLEHHEDDVGEKPLVRSEATGLLRTLNRLETMLMRELLSDILERFEKVSQTLQKVDTSLERAVRLYEPLVSFIDTLREISPLYEQKAKKQCNIDYETSCYKHQRKRKPQYDESKEQEVILKGKDTFGVEFVCSS